MCAVSCLVVLFWLVGCQYHGCPAMLHVSIALSLYVAIMTLSCSDVVRNLTVL